MLIVIIRHPESTKNQAKTFSSANAQEQLTPLGSEQLIQVVKRIAEFRVLHAGLTAKVYTADSVRAGMLGEAISESLGAPLVRMSELTSVRAGDISGMPEDVVRATYEEYFRHLSVYRAGLFSSYTLNHPGESLRAFEARVDRACVAIENSGADLVFVIAHKSAATAALIRYARRFHDYPQEFFGFLDLPTASISLVEVQDTGSGCIWIAGSSVNRACDWLRQHWRAGT